MVTSMNKEVVRIYTDGDEDDNTGRFVKCNDCGELQLISKSKKSCGKCESKNIIPVKDDMKIVTPEDIESFGYNLEFVIQIINRTPFKQEFYLYPNEVLTTVLT